MLPSNLLILQTKWILKNMLQCTVRVASVLHEPCVTASSLFLPSPLCLQGDANRSYSDDDHSSSNFDESEKHDSIKLSGELATCFFHSLIITVIFQSIRSTLPKPLQLQARFLRRIGFISRRGCVLWLWVNWRISGEVTIIEVSEGF